MIYYIIWFQQIVYRFKSKSPGKYTVIENVLMTGHVNLAYGPLDVAYKIDPSKVMTYAGLYEIGDTWSYEKFLISRNIQLSGTKVVCIDRVGSSIAFIKI